MKPMTPEEVAKKYTKPDGTIVIPGDVRIIMPTKSDAQTNIKIAAIKNGAKVKLG